MCLRTKNLIQNPIQLEKLENDLTILEKNEKGQFIFFY